MGVVSKIAGIIVCIIGICIWGIDYLIFTAIGALTTWIAGAVGITGLAVFGLQIIGWILTLGIMLLIAFAGFCVITGGLGMISD